MNDVKYVLTEKHEKSQTYNTFPELFKLKMLFLSLFYLVLSYQTVEERAFHQILNSIPVPEHHINKNEHRGKKS